MTFAPWVLAWSLVLSPAQDARVADWTEDIEHLVAEIERLHPDPYFAIPREEFLAAKDALIGGMAKRSDDEIVVELMRLVALLSKKGRDGHSFVWSSSFRRLPLQLHSFDDGWFVVGAGSPHEALIGSKLLAIGSTPVEQAAETILPILTKDNDWNARSKVPFVLMTAEVLRALAIVPPGDEIRLRLERAGAISEVSLPATFDGPPPRFLPPVGELPWFRDRQFAWWSTVLEKERALYVQYNHVRSQDSKGNTLADFAAGLVRTFEERQLERLILDLRSNGGGDNTTFGPLIEALRGNDRLNRKGRLFALIGRDTFSAAANFVTVLDRDTQALLVGEPTGGAPNQYGDAQTVELPKHKEVLVRIVTRYHAIGGPDDARLTHEPDLPVPYTSADYFGGRDPVLQRALEHEEK